MAPRSGLKLWIASRRPTDCLISSSFPVIHGPILRIARQLNHHGIASAAASAALLLRLPLRHGRHHHRFHPGHCQALDQVSPAPVSSCAAGLTEARSIGNEIGVSPQTILETSHGRRSIDVFKTVAPHKATWECKFLRRGPPGSRLPRSKPTHGLRVAQTSDRSRSRFPSCTRTEPSRSPARARFSMP